MEQAKLRDPVQKSVKLFYGLSVVSHAFDEAHRTHFKMETTLFSTSLHHSKCGEFC